MPPYEAISEEPSLVSDKPPGGPIPRSWYAVEKIRMAGKTIIMIEHRLKELFRIADRVIVLNYGEKIAEGNAAEVMESDAVKKAYLGAEA